MGQHHRVFLCSGKIRIDFGVSGIMVSGQVYRLFVKRVCDRPVYLAGHGQFNHLLYIPKRRFTGGCRYFSALQRVQIHQLHIVNIDGTILVLCLTDRLDCADFDILSSGNLSGLLHYCCIADYQRAALVINFFLCQGFYGDLRADAGRISHRDSKN